MLAQLQREELVRSALQLSSLHLPTLSAAEQRPLLQHRRTTIEDENRLDAVEKELQHAPQHAEHVRIRQHLPLAVAHRFEELDEPDARVDRQCLAADRLNRNASPARLQQLPQTSYSHCSHGVATRRALSKDLRSPRIRLGRSHT